MGAGIAAAGLFLWPFAGWPWLPLLIGLGVLVLLRLLRLNGLMRGWAPHVAGLVVVGLLLVRTSPWEWALAVSLGIVVAGLTRLPRWHVLAAGAVLLLVSGIGYGFTLQQENADKLAQQIQRGDENRDQLGERTVTRVLPSLMAYTARNEPATVCGLLTDEAELQFAAAVGAQDCTTAVGLLAARVSDIPRYSEPERPPITQNGGTWLIDGCQTTWNPPVPEPGPRLGKIQVTQNADQKFIVTGYAACR